ncbi:hypothetical protein CMUS01_12453 [Colletotrichum musicola]|uniref:Uncharacterized protein n=1 Tax=Colletotrichum musicola TaxID=2175873 RepID=A0A8H6JME1_9PEZI|nr:hypothetical protein CMUS01_12453 [Colletotrichum musicola]
MGRRIYPRTVVEEAPSHDGRPCYAAWKMSEADPNAQTPPDTSNRPKWSIQLYDTTPKAADRTYVRAIAKQVEESTCEARRRREAHSRIEVHGLPLPAGTSDAERATLCAAHHRAELAARNASGAAADFFIPPTFDAWWEHRILVAVGSDNDDGDDPRAGEATRSGPEADGKDGGGPAFLAVFFGMKPEAAAENPGGGPDMDVVRFSGEELGDRMLGFTSSIEWFYNSYVGDGTIYSDLKKWRREGRVEQQDRD